MRNQTSDLQIQHSDALPQSHRDSMVSEVYYEVYLTIVLHTTRSMRQIKNSESSRGIESWTIKLFCHKTKTKESSIRVMENGTESH